MSNPSGSFDQFSSGQGIHASQAKKENLWPYLLGFFILNLIIKSFSITKVSFDLDEAWHTYFSQKGTGEILKIAGTDPNGPFYNLLLHFWIQLFGVSEVATRSLSLILSAATAPLLFLMGKKYFNSLTGIFAALIFSFTNLHFFYSHNARVYALICFLAALSFLFAFKLIKTQKYSAFISLIIVNTLLLYTHLTTAFFIAAQGLAALLFFSVSRKGTLLTNGAQIISGLLFVPWVLLTPYYNEPVHGVWLSPPSWHDVKLALFDFSGTEYILKLFIALFVLSFIIRKRNSWPDSWKLQLVLFIWFCFPILFSFFVSHRLVPVFMMKYVITSSLGLYMLIAYSISQFRFGTGIKFIAIAYLLVRMYPTIGTYEFISEDWRTAVNEVKKRKTDRSIVVVSPWYMNYPFSYYYNREYYVDTENTLVLLNKDKVFFGESKEMLLEKPTDYDDVILLTTHEKMANPESVLGYLHDNFLPEFDTTITNINMYCFKKKVKTAFESDMETVTQSFRSNKVVDTAFARSGTKVSVMDEENIYSATFEDKLGAFSNQSTSIIACGWVYYDNKNTDCAFVVSFENADGVFHYDAAEIAESGPQGKWFRICRNVKIPAQAKPEDIIKVYFWNKTKYPVYADDMEITEIK